MKNKQIELPNDSKAWLGFAESAMINQQYLVVHPSHLITLLKEVYYHRKVNKLIVSTARKYLDEAEKLKNELINIIEGNSQ